MPNNPIIPPTVPPNSAKPEQQKPINEVKTAPNSFNSGIDRTVPVDDPTVKQVAQEVTGKKMTYEEQVEYIKNLPDDLMVEFARRVQGHIKAEAEQTIKPKKLQYVTDFSTLQENSVFDLNTPIQAIDYQIPEYLDIKLLDSNFAPRWIQTSSKNIGTRRSQGWSYITKEDLAEKLKVEIEADAAGHFVYIDTVAMKIPKSKLFSQLRSNYLRAIALTQQSKLHEKMKAAIESEIQGSMDDRTGMPLGDAWNKYNSEGKMTTYSPLG